MSRRAVMAGLAAATFLILSAVATGVTAARAPAGVCPTQAPCPPRAAPCDIDDQCGADQRCCAAACGRVCLDPLYTGCENIIIAADRVSRALAAEAVGAAGAGPRGARRVSSGIRAPRCRSDGEFEPVQCDNEIVSSCWCVDEAGFELAGTRAPAAALVNCSRPAACAAHTCRMLCPLGFELDARGCPLCKCRDPCERVKCPGALACQLEETPCLKPPCPPVPTCKRGRSLQNICPVGEPLLIPETHRPFLCGTDPGKPNCPPLHRCLVESGNDYGVCCPASLELRKAGTCPSGSDGSGAPSEECGAPCAHDLECPSVQKCCDGASCGRHCALPLNVTECLQQRHLAELLAVSEREGRGYVPQCSASGAFEPRQCSRNGLVCWCVDREGHKLRGSMGPADGVTCAPDATSARTSGRALAAARCGRALCATVCEYGYRAGADGCPSCACDDPCAGFTCPSGEECVRVRDAACVGDFCAGHPVCRPRVAYENPCAAGSPHTNSSSGEPAACARDADCPAGHLCVAELCCPPADQADEAMDITQTAACPASAEETCAESAACAAGACGPGLVCCRSRGCGDVCIDLLKHQLQHDDPAPASASAADTDLAASPPPTMCEYLRDFDEKMEGTVDGMRLALPAPSCHSNGSFTETQCAAGRCWCVDSFGTEIPRTGAEGAPAQDCVKLRSELECLELTCRMGCDYGFELSDSSRCPTCRCRDPCAGVACPRGRACAVVDVACDGDYCPSVPACLPRKAGQCPYLVPTGGSCEFSCRSDAECGDGERCCATGCGTACARAVLQTACQQRRALALHAASERGAPPASLSVPACTPEGAFERVQCRANDATCWCVDDAGAEVPGTRVRGGATPACDAPAACPAPACPRPLDCEHGPALDERGCPGCSCHDPCAELVCPGEETCTLASVECTSAPCPRLAVCAPPAACPGGAPPLAAPGGEGPLLCGPAAASCPSSHSCRYAPHDNTPPVCCPKPRTVCFEHKPEGGCADEGGVAGAGGVGVNTTRWFFNRDRNRCEKFRYTGCSVSHNNFHSLEICNAVCPVLSRCERLREKNALAAQRYGRPTFTPACDPRGDWQPVQCMHHIDVCWCVSGLGEPQKGSLVRGARPDCNFRRARGQRGNNTHADDVLEELIRQMTALRVSEFEREDEEYADEGDAGDARDEGEAEVAEAEAREAGADEEGAATQADEVVSLPPGRLAVRSKCLELLARQTKENSPAPVQCQPSGSFSPRQCDTERCWCVDEAGRVIQDNNTDFCEHTRVESIVVSLWYARPLAAAAAERARGALAARLASLGARGAVGVRGEGGGTALVFTLRQHNKVDLLYHLENIVNEERARAAGAAGAAHAEGAGEVPDEVRAEYRLAPLSAPATLQREILSESTVSAATSYHTALIVLAATSAFIISVLSVLLMLYRAQLSRREPPKQQERFLPYAPPVYVLSPDEKADLARVLSSTEMSLNTDIPKV